MTHTIFDTPVLTTFMRGVAWLWMKLTGWRFVGEMPPDLGRCVLVCAPHTSNWDLVYVVVFSVHLRFKPRWMGKDSLFKWPFGPLFEWLGGLPIDRSKANNMVDACIKAFEKHKTLTLGITPEATRTKVAVWKSGFYHIAKGAGVPIIASYLDFKRKVGGFGATIFPSGNRDADLEIIRSFYATVTGKHPENYEKAWTIAPPKNADGKN